MNIGRESGWRKLTWWRSSPDLEMGIRNLAFDYNCLCLNPIWIFSWYNRGNTFLLLFLSLGKFIIIRETSFLRIYIYNFCFSFSHLGAIIIGYSNHITLYLAMLIWNYGLVDGYFSILRLNDIAVVNFSCFFASIWFMNFLVGWLFCREHLLHWICQFHLLVLFCFHLWGML